MWERDNVDVNGVIESVWKDPVLEGTVDSYVSRVNVALPNAYPRRLSRSGRHLTWIER
jgi:hypothetical protein